MDPACGKEVISSNAQPKHLQIVEAWLSLPHLVPLFDFLHQPQIHRLLGGGTAAATIGPQPIPAIGIPGRTPPVKVATVVKGQVTTPARGVTSRTKRRTKAFAVLKWAIPAVFWSSHRKPRECPEQFQTCCHCSRINTGNKNHCIGQGYDSSGNVTELEKYHCQGIHPIGIRSNI